MIVLDTNAISEPTKARPEPAVVSWLSVQPPQTSYFTAIGLAELLLSLEIMPVGFRRATLEAALLGLGERFLGSHVLSFDVLAAQAYAARVARARAWRRVISVADGQIAAIAAARGFAVATPDEAPFAATGVKTIDPRTTGP